MCVAFCEQYQGWYRARVAQVSPDGKVIFPLLVVGGGVGRELLRIGPIIIWSEKSFCAMAKMVKTLYH